MADGSTSNGAVFDLLSELISRRSLTPDDADCCKLLESRLAPLGFSFEYIDAGGVTNLWATLAAALR